MRYARPLAAKEPDNRIPFIAKDRSGRQNLKDREESGVFLKTRIQGTIFMQSFLEDFRIHYVNGDQLVISGTIKMLIGIRSSFVFCYYFIFNKIKI